MPEWFDTMTKYELMTIFLSFVVFIKPLVIWGYKKINTKLLYFPNNEVYLFFNNSGSYIQIYGACKAKNSNLIIKNIEVTLTKRRNSEKLNLVWSGFISPVMQKMAGNFIFTNEKAHPFQIHENIMCPVFVEFSLKGLVSEKNIGVALNGLLNLAQSEQCNVNLLNQYDVNRMLSDYKNSDVYKDTRELIVEEFFWDAGGYDLEMVIEYGDNSKINYSTSFNITPEDSNKLKNNIDEILLMPVKARYNLPTNFYAHMISN